MSLAMLLVSPLLSISLQWSVGNSPSQVKRSWFSLILFLFYAGIPPPPQLQFPSDASVDVSSITVTKMNAKFI